MERLNNTNAPSDNDIVFLQQFEMQEAAILQALAS
tara:strand:+ start:166 stop:270 length:105 start_codon:yes stop_codon:yes gene_type:complete